MGCVRSKEDKGPALKYRPDNSNATPASSLLGPYGPEPTLMGHSPAMNAHNNSYNSHAANLTPFGGTSSVMTPFGGASSSFTSVAVSSPFPSVISGTDIFCIHIFIFGSLGSYKCAWFYLQQPNGRFSKFSFFCMMQRKCPRTLE